MTETLNPWEMGDQFDPRTISWVLDHERLGLLIAAISTAAEVVTDLETTGLDEHATGLKDHWPVAARVSLASFTLPQESNPLDPRPPTYVLPLSHPEGPWAGQWVRIYRSLLEALRSSGKPITNQNLKFDMRWMTARTGVDLSAQFAWDTQIGSHLLNENASTRLKERAPAAFGVPPWDDHDLSTPAASEKVPLMELGEYAARDTYWTWRLAVLQRTIMAVGAEGEDADPPEGPDEVEAYRLGQLAVWCAMPQARTLTEVEQRGLLMDEVWVKDHIAEYEEIRDSEWRWLTRRYADDLGEHDHEGDHDCRRCRLETEPSFAPTSLWFQAWADLAVERGDLRVAELTPGGKPKWSKSVLTRHARNGKEVAAHLLAYRKAVKRLEFLNSWMDCQTPEHTVHTTYNVGRVVTGRLSSNSPNVQQIEYALKQGFIPRPGYLIADLDYSQIELRVAAHVAQCEPMIEAYRQGRDLHRMLAADTAGVPEAEVTADQRQRGKAGNFGFLYGMSAAGFMTYALDSYDVMFTAEEAEEIRSTFFSTWEGLAAWHQRVINIARRDGQIMSPIGRVRRVPHIWDGNDYMASEAERQAINSPVQGFASDLMQMAAASIHGNLPGFTRVPDVHIVGTVHDSIVVEVPEDDWQRATARCMRRMLDLDPVLKRLGCSLTVPLAVEAGVGSRWGLADIGSIK